MKRAPLLVFYMYIVREPAIYKTVSNRLEFDIPETIEDEIELNKDATKWQYASNERGGDQMGQAAPFRYLMGDLVAFDWWFRPLKRERERESERCA